MSVTESTDVQGAAVLADGLSGSPPYTVHGVAIGPDETTQGMSGQLKFWPGDALRDAASTLQGKNIVKNHVNNDVDAVVGAVTQARYDPQHGVVFKGEIDDEELAQQIARERLDVSPRIIHAHVDELEENDDGALVVDEIREFANLATVPRGAAESNMVRIGESGMLSRAELAEALDEDADDPDQEEELDVEETVGTGEELAEEEDAENESNLCDCCGCEDCGEDCGCCEECSEAQEDEPVEETEPSILSELEVLGADSEETDVDISELEILR